MCLVTIAMLNVLDYGQLNHPNVKKIQHRIATALADCGESKEHVESNPHDAGDYR